jgi:hypothetical protein
MTLGHEVGEHRGPEPAHAGNFNGYPVDADTDLAAKLDPQGHRVTLSARSVRYF